MYSQGWEGIDINHEIMTDSTSMLSCLVYRDSAESNIDVFAGVIEDLYQRADSEAKGYVNWKMFSQLLQSAEMNPYVLEKDHKDLQDLFKSTAPSGKASYDQFRVVAKEMILLVYRAKDPSDVCKCTCRLQQKIFISFF